MSADAERLVSRFGTPFRVGSTSYVYPDDILPNVRRLAADGDVDDIELILFEVDDGATNLPDLRTIDALCALAAQHRLTYSVHLPLDFSRRWQRAASIARQGRARHPPDAAARAVCLRLSP